MSYPSLKRFLDVVGAVTLLVLSLPLQLVVAAVVAVSMGRPVFFRQQRPGLNGRVFTMYKFRSMHEPRGPYSDDARRLTPVGRFIRATSLDELPELWNVLRGDMSMVGPRPLLVDYLPLYSAEQARRHEAKPGVTGLAQVSGRNAVGWDQRFALDVAYVETVSFWGDLRILWQTAGLVLRRSGVAAEGHSTMTPFTGEAAA